MKDSMNSNLQENVLTVLCFHSDAAKIIRGYLTPDLFESAVFQEIAEKAMDFLDQFGTAVGEHLPDVLENTLGKAEERKKRLYENTLVNLFGFKDSVNIEYTLSQLTKFVRQQKLKQSLTSAVKFVQENDLDQAEAALSSHLKTSLEVFDGGLFFADIPKRYGKIFGEHATAFSTGIAPMDELGIGPNRKELFTILTLPNKGKSWMMIHLAKFGLLQRLKVLYLTLEMSEDKIAGRFLQNLFSISKREADLQVTLLKKDALGRFSDMDFVKIKRPHLQDPDITKFLNKKISQLGSRLPLVIKQFPTAQLTIRGLESYLDLLERSHNFVPDMICVDYADLMQIDSAQLRVDTGRLYKELRGLAVDRNCAIVTASQSNRQGMKDKWITMENFAEDFSKAGISDIVLSYNQTGPEYKLGLARLFLPKVRDEAKEQAILISQNYNIGQFCIDSIKMEDVYWEQLKAKANDGEDE